MTGIDRYISELLFDHDCVILPGFGGFLTNYSGARIHPIRHSFSPPGRTVIFNANLRTNDGLLTDYVCRSESIPYKDASLKVNEFASRCMRELESGREIEFRNIGRCRMGKEKNIIFEPDEHANYLSDAFGLPSFVSPAIKRETVRERIEKQLTPRPAGTTEKKHRRLRPAAGWAAGIAIPVAAALLLYFYNPGILDQLDKSYASFVPTVKFGKATHQPVTSSTSNTAEFNDFRVIPEVVAEPEQAEPSLPEAAAEKPGLPALTKYQVVVGSFSNETNARHYVEKLRAKNYDASIVGTNRNGLSRVSINGSDNKSEAIRIMERIRNSENPSAWLLRIR